MDRLQPVTLSGCNVRLEPLSYTQLDALAEIGLDPDLWRLSPANIQTRDDLAAYVRAALTDQAEGRSLPFAIVARGTTRSPGERIAGSTRFGNIDLPNRRLEIGWTWLGRDFQRTGINTEAKYLLLTHAFESLGMNRVEFKTDSLNERSRKALLRIGAVEEGTFRRHMVTWTGRLRDSAYFSVIAEEWPSVKARLEEKLETVRNS